MKGIIILILCLNLLSAGLTDPEIRDPKEIDGKICEWNYHSQDYVCNNHEQREYKNPLSIIFPIWGITGFLLLLVFYIKKKRKCKRTLMNK